MPNKLDESLRPHLSALVDGELEPLEAIAIQRHVRLNAVLAAEQRSLEQLKLAVHLAGTRDKPGPGVRARLLAGVHQEAEARRSRGWAWRWVVPLATAVAVAAALVIALAGGTGREVRPPTATADRLAPPRSLLPAWRAWGSAAPQPVEKHFLLAARANGCHADYGHGDLAIGGQVREDLYVPIARFLGGDPAPLGSRDRGLALLGEKGAVDG